MSATTHSTFTFAYVDKRDLFRRSGSTICTTCTISIAQIPRTLGDKLGVVWVVHSAMFKVNVQWWCGGLFDRDVTKPKFFGKCLARVYCKHRQQTWNKMR
jgi:hypothetical protein